jgi:hypothetical protein
LAESHGKEGIEGVKGVEGMKYSQRPWDEKRSRSKSHRVRARVRGKNEKLDREHDGMQDSVDERFREKSRGIEEWRNGGMEEEGMGSKIIEMEEIEGA